MYKMHTTSHALLKPFVVATAMCTQLSLQRFTHPMLRGVWQWLWADCVHKKLKILTRDIAGWQDVALPSKHAVMRLGHCAHFVQLTCRPVNKPASLGSAKLKRYPSALKAHAFSSIHHCAPTTLSHITTVKRQQQRTSTMFSTTAKHFHHVLQH
jgi:hypothetical protein